MIIKKGIKTMNTIKEHDALEFIDSLLTPEEISERSDFHKKYDRINQFDSLFL